MAEDFIRCGDLIVSLTTPEYFLAKAWVSMIDEGVLSTVFYQGVPTLQGFLADALTPGRRITLSAFRELPDKKLEFAGLGWVFGNIDLSHGHRRGETGMWFSSRQSRKTDNLKYGAMMFDIFFEHHQIDALFGATPEPNRLAIRYAQKLGMRLFGPVPDYCVWKGCLTPCWLSHINRRDWLARRAALTPQAVA